MQTFSLQKALESGSCCGKCHDRVRRPSVQSDQVRAERRKVRGDEEEDDDEDEEEVEHTPTHQSSCDNGISVFSQGDAPGRS